MYQYHEDMEHGGLAMSPEEQMMLEEDGDLLDMFSIDAESETTDVAPTTPASVSPTTPASVSPLAFFTNRGNQQ